MSEQHDLLTCPKCDNSIIIQRASLTRGGDQDCAVALECEECSHVLRYNVGADADVFEVISGAVLISAYVEEPERPGDRQRDERIEAREVEGLKHILV